jgi:hypothetical protein
MMQMILYNNDSNPGTRREYHYVDGPYYADESYEGSPVVGRWEHDDFRPIKVLWWTPRFSVTSAHVAQLANRKYAVRRKGMNFAWKGINRDDVVFDEFLDATDLLEARIELVNKACLWSSIRNLIFEAGVLLFFIGLAVVSFRRG